MTVTAVQGAEPEDAYYHWEYNVYSDNYSIDFVEPYEANDGSQYFSVFGDYVAGLAYNFKNNVNWVDDGNFSNGIYFNSYGGQGPYEDIILTHGDSATFEFDTPVCAVVDATGYFAAANIFHPQPAQGVVKGPAVVGVSLATPELIPINANNDHSAGKPVATRWVANTTNTIPVTRDYEITVKLNAADPQLQKATISVAGLLPGTLSVTYNGPTVGQVRLWDDAVKSQQFVSVQVPAGGGFSKDIYIEGLHESYALGDIQLKATFEPGVPALPIPVHDTKKIAVTPIVKRFESVIITAKPTPFIDVNAGGVVVGMTSGEQLPNNASPSSKSDAISFETEIITGGYESEGKFVQAVTSVKQRNANTSNFEVVNPNIKANAVFPFGQTGIIDSSDASTVPYYRKTPLPPPANNPPPLDIKRFMTVDTPAFAIPIGANQLKRFDLIFETTMWVVWTYNDGSLYPLGYIKWKVDYAGDLIIATFTVRQGSATTAEPFVRSNATPSILSGDTFNSFISKGTWIVNTP